MNTEVLDNRYSIVIGIAISIAAVIVSSLQVYITIQNNKLIEAQTIESFIPHLMENKTKDIALVTMYKYVDRDIVNEMASLLKSESALEVLTKKGTETERKSTEKALKNLNKERVLLINKMFSNVKSERIAATTSLYRNWNHTGQLLEEVLAKGEKLPENKSGVINILVLLSGFDSSLLLSYKKELEKFFKVVEKNGPQTLSRINNLREIINKADQKITN